MSSQSLLGSGLWFRGTRLTSSCTSWDRNPFLVQVFGFPAVPAGRWRGQSVGIAIPSWFRSLVSVRRLSEKDAIRLLIAIPSWFRSLVSLENGASLWQTKSRYRNPFLVQVFGFPVNQLGAELVNVAIPSWFRSLVSFRGRASIFRR